MKIINLVENTEGAACCAAEHGLSFYIETARHRLLMDTGASSLLLENAQKLGVDLSLVDTVVISHGHYDHGGGLPAFFSVNDTARVYIHAQGRQACYTVHASQEPRYIGLPQEVIDSDRVVWVDEDLVIDPELTLLCGIGQTHPSPSGNRDLKVKRGDALVQDDFDHEMCLVVTEGERNILFSGCAHHGILNVLERFRKTYRKDPDAVLSGFHMMRSDRYDDEDVRQIVETARALRQTKTMYYTGHCTGAGPYRVMKKQMGDQLQYVHCGDTVTLTYPEKDEPEKKTGEGKKRSSYMKCHKFFAWATVVCFVMTMVTGYKRK